MSPRLSHLDPQLTTPDQGILVLRTYAIWDYDTRLGLGLFTALIGTCIFEGFYLMKVAKSFLCEDLSKRWQPTFTNAGYPVIESPSPLEFPGCFISQVDPSPAQPAYLTLLVFETCKTISITHGSSYLKLAKWSSSLRSSSSSVRTFPNGRLRSEFTYSQVDARLTMGTRQSF